jgi:hypothetical protein
MLMATVPLLDRKWEEVRVELKAKEAELAGGCVYCARCAEVRPELVQVEEDHLVACHLDG